MNTKDANKLTEDLENALIVRKRLREKLEAARKEHLESCDEVQSLLQKLDPPKGRSVFGKWVISRGFESLYGIGGDSIQIDPLQTIEVVKND